jgi:hypothetical protein
VGSYSSASTRNCLIEIEGASLARVTSPVSILCSFRVRGEVGDERLVDELVGRGAVGGGGR